MVNENSKNSREILCRSERIQMILYKSFDLIVTNLGLSSDFPLLKMPDKDCRACNNCAKPRCDAQLTPLFRYMLAWKKWSYLERTKMKNVLTIRKKPKKSTRPNIASNSFCNNCQLALISELWAYAIVLTIFLTQIYIRRGCLICFTQEYRPSHIFFLRGIYDPLRLAIFCKKKIRLVSNSRFSTRR